MAIIAVYGCGGFGREVAPIAAHADKHDVVFVSDDANSPRAVNGVSVMSLHELKETHPHAEIVIAIADYGTRRTIAERCLREGFSFGIVKPPSARIYVGAGVGPGAILCEYTMVMSNARVGAHFHSNIYSFVGHDCEIGDYVTFAPRVTCNGNVQIADNVYVGAAAIIRQGRPGNPLKIGEGAVIGMGAVVTKDVPPGAVMVGNPARPMEKAGSSKKPSAG